MTGFERYLRILRLFDEDQSTWTVAEISETLDTSASTLYRLVREMVAAGFLESTVEARYRLGPAFIEFERRIRLTDPLVRAGVVFLQPLLQHVAAPCIAILARLYGDTVMCVADTRAPGLSIETSYERGRPMPLVRGATSRAILAGIETRRLRRLLASEARLDDTRRDILLQDLAQVRKTGLSVTRGEVDKGAIGLAAPVRNRMLGIHASLSVIMAEQDCHALVRDRIVALLGTNARMIEAFMDDTLASHAPHASTSPPPMDLIAEIR